MVSITWKNPEQKKRFPLARKSVKKKTFPIDGKKTITAKSL